MKQFNQKFKLLEGNVFLSRKLWSWIIIFFALSFSIILASCSLDSSRKWRLYNVEGHLPNLKFSLESAEGKNLTQEDFKGKIVLLFFGYANCPDICPTTINQLNTVLKNLNDKSNEIRILFISIDPHRDNPKALQKYLNSFHGDIIGLTGNESDISNLARRYRVAYQIDKPKKELKIDDLYEVTHSRGIYIFDYTGKARLLASNTDSPADLVDDLLKLISSKP